VTNPAAAAANSAAPNQVYQITNRGPTQYSTKPMNNKLWSKAMKAKATKQEQLSFTRTQAPHS